MRKKQEVEVEEDIEMDRIAFAISADTKRLFRLYCMMEGTTMTDVLIASIEDHLRVHSQ